MSYVLCFYIYAFYIPHVHTKKHADTHNRFSSIRLDSTQLDSARLKSNRIDWTLGAQAKPNCTIHITCNTHRHYIISFALICHIRYIYVYFILFGVYRFDIHSPSLWRALGVHFFPCTFCALMLYCMDLVVVVAVGFCEYVSVRSLVCSLVHTFVCLFVTIRCFHWCGKQYMRYRMMWIVRARGQIDWLRPGIFEKRDRLDTEWRDKKEEDCFRIRMRRGLTRQKQLNPDSLSLSLSLVDCGSRLRNLFKSLWIEENSELKELAIVTAAAAVVLVENFIKCSIAVCWSPSHKSPSSSLYHCVFHISVLLLPLIEQERARQREHEKAQVKNQQGAKCVLIKVLFPFRFLLHWYLRVYLNNNNISFVDVVVDVVYCLLLSEISSLSLSRRRIKWPYKNYYYDTNIFIIKLQIYIMLSVFHCCQCGRHCRRRPYQWHLNDLFLLAN